MIKIEQFEGRNDSERLQHMRDLIDAGRNVRLGKQARIWISSMYRTNFLVGSEIGMIKFMTYSSCDLQTRLRWIENAVTERVARKLAR